MRRTPRTGDSPQATRDTRTTLAGLAMAMMGVGLAATPARAHAAGAVDAFTVAIDPGHGGTMLGAEGVRPGVVEKQVTLDIARRVRRHLETRGGVKVVMCRERDALVPIRARVRCANDALARLFVSIHANASPMGPSRGTQRGFEIYVSPLDEVDLDVAAAARRARDPAEAAWAGHRIRAAAADALSAARRIGWRLADTLGRDRDRGIKQAGASLDVLQGLAVPGVLVEVGFLDHPEEGLELASEDGRERIARALAEAILDVRARERRGRTDPAITTQRRPAQPAPEDP